MDERITVENGKGIIGIFYDGLVTSLKIRKPVVADWYDNYGTVGRYFVLSPEADQIDKIHNFNNVLINGSEEEVRKELLVFMQLFCSGEYHISQRCSLVNQDEIQYSTSHFYNDTEVNYMFTQPFSAIDNERVAFYKEKIRNGLRPKVLIFGHNNGGYSDTTFYILDGHHKFVAYLNLNLPCEFIYIGKMDRDEGENVKAGLFNTYKYLVDDVLATEIICNNPLVCTDDNFDCIRYNFEFDQYLYSFRKYISADIFRTIMRTVTSENPVEKQWGLNKLRILRYRVVIRGEKIKLYLAINQTLYARGGEVSSLEDFNKLMQHTFEKAWQDI